MTRPKQSPSYGKRGRLGGADRGIRRVAPTFGKELHLTSSSKSSERFAVESDAERLISQALTIDPRVGRFEAQPFTVDLIDARVLHTGEEVSEARKRHKHRTGPRFYSPDFGVSYVDASRGAIEVKREGWEGGAGYEDTLAAAQEILDASGWRFQRLVVPASTQHPLWANVPLLKKAASRKDLWPDAEQVGRIDDAFSDGPMPLLEACRRLGVIPSLVPMYLVCGALRADVFRGHINGVMVLEPAFGDLGHLQLIEELSA